MALQNHKLAKPSFFVAYSRLCRHCHMLREVVSCRNFILPSVAPFWVMSLVGIYRCRASVIINEVYVIKFCIYMWHLGDDR